MAKTIFHEDLCKGCLLCASVCPKKIIEVDAERLNVRGFHPASIRPGNMDKCIGCAFCATICPDVVIEVMK
jgi:2-oxoglutarate ferredoxin oxidoreductase subunit delta